MRRLHWWRVPLLLLCITASSGAVLLMTETGLRWSFALLAHGIPGELTAKRLEGRLLGPFSLRGLHYRYGNTQLSLEHLQIAWQPGRLFAATLHVTELYGEDLDLELDDDGQAPSPQALPELKFPLGITLADARLERITVRLAGDPEPINLRQLAVQAEARWHTISLQRLRLEGVGLALAVHGQLKPHGRYPLDLSLNWQWQAPGHPELRGQGSATGDLDRLVLAQQLVAPAPAELHLTLLDLIGKPRWQARATVHRLESTHLPYDLKPGFTVAANVEAQGDNRSIEARGSVRGTVETLGDVEVRWRADYAEQLLQVHDLSLSLPHHRAAFQGQGKVSFLPQIAYQLQGSWRDIGWPLKQPRLLSQRGTLSLQGVGENYQITVDLDLVGKGIPAGHWTAMGTGDLQQLDFSQLSGKLLEGEVRGSAKLARLPHWQWESNLTGKELNPAVQWPDWPGRLGFEGRFDGNLADGRLAMDLHIPTVSGSLRGYDLSGNSQLNWQNGRLAVSSLDVRSGSAHLGIRGSLGKELQLQWWLSAARLGELYPDARGALNANGQVSGPLDAPYLQLQLDGHKLAVSKHAADTLTARLALDLQDRLPLQVDIQANGAALAGVAVKSVSLHGTGLIKEHRLSATIITAQQSVLAELEAGLTRNDWQGRLINVSLDDAQLGRWHLEQPAPFRLSRTESQLAQTCLKGRDARICLDGRWKADAGGQGTLQTEQFPLQLLQPYLPPRLALEGRLDGRARLVAEREIPMTVDAALSLGSGQLILTVDQDINNRVELPFSGGRIQMTATVPGTLHADVALDLTGTDRIHSSLRIPKVEQFPADLTRQPAEGWLRATIHDLTLIELLLPETKNIRGVLSVDTALKGPLQDPVITGHARLDNTSFEIPRLGLRLTDVQLVAQSEGPKNIRLKGSAQSGDGQISLNGTLTPPDAEGWSTKLTLNGDRFEVARIPEARVQVSPRLNLQLAPHRIHITGEVTIPEARIEPRDISLAVTPSKDVVIVDAEAMPLPERYWRISGQIRLHAPDSIRFIGYGYDGRIGGDLLLVEEQGKLTRARGELHAVEGSKYKAFGQKLQVEHGQLIFVDSPVDNPNLNINAVRRIGDIVAGVRVQGTARVPELTLFSRPPMDQADILSHLILGRPIARAGQADGQILMKATTTAGLAGGNYLAGVIGRQFGLEEARLETQVDTEQPWLVLGTYLSPRMYVRYGLALFEPGSSVLLRYQLRKQWQLQGETGSNSGVDLLYTLDRP